MLATPDSDALHVALLVLRLYFGVGLMYHGLRKITGGVDNTAAWFASIGMRRPGLQARAAIASEIGGGALLALGLLTPFAAAAIIGTMLVAGWLVHREHFLILQNGWELVGSYAIGALAVGTVGAGRFSLDHAFDITWSGWNGLLISLLLGVGAGVGVLAAFWRPDAAATR